MISELRNFEVLILVKATGPEDALLKSAIAHERINVVIRTREDQIPKPVPRDEWPMWAKALAQFSTAEDKGVGDVATRTIGAENSAAFKLWFKATFNRDCGCNGRHKLWNQKYPFNLKAT